ncbi:hypothetical protein D3C86_1453170 [compost metagenome]
MVIVVQEDDVQVRGIAQFLAAQPAVGDHREARRVAVARGQLAPDRFQRGLEHGIGQVGQAVGHLLHRQHALQVLQQHAEGLDMMLAPQDVHLLLDLALGGQQPLMQALAEGGPVGRAGQRIAVEQFVQQLRVPRQVGRGPARGMQRLRDAVHRLRVLG